MVIKMFCQNDVALAFKSFVKQTSTSSFKIIFEDGGNIDYHLSLNYEIEGNSIIKNDEFPLFKIENLSIFLERLTELLNKMYDFHLKDKDIYYIKEKGLDVIKTHAYDFITKRLKPKFIENDGKQTPMKGHPVFIAQHATGCCCRGCLERIHNIKKGHELENKEIDYIVDVIIRWIKKEVEI